MTANNHHDQEEGEEEPSTFDAHIPKQPYTQLFRSEGAVGFEVSAPQQFLPSLVSPTPEKKKKQQQRQQQQRKHRHNDSTSNSWPFQTQKQSEEVEIEPIISPYEQVIPVSAVPSASVLQGIPSVKHSIQSRRVEDYMDVTNNHNDSTPVNHSSSPPTATSSSSCSPWKNVFQRCVADCYCLSNNHDPDNGTESNTTPVDSDTVTEGQQQPQPPCTFFPPLELVPVPNLLLFDDDDDDRDSDRLSEIIPEFCHQLQQGPHKARRQALLKLFELSNRNHVHNRIPLVCTNQWDILTALGCVLDDVDTTHKEYRQALLILSNLTVPFENKAVVLLSPQHSQRILQHLWQAIDTDVNHAPVFLHRKSEIHLVCAILFNLSFLQDGTHILANFVPYDHHYHYQQQQQCSADDDETNNPNNNNHNHKKHYAIHRPSLLASLEQLLDYYQPFVAPEHKSDAASPCGNIDDDKNNNVPIASMERQAMRWTMGTVKNLCSDASNARLIGRTQIPVIALTVLQNSPLTQVSQWNPQSLEDFCLSLLVELALREQETTTTHGNAIALVPVLQQITCRPYLSKLLAVEGIHTIRAKAIVQQFDDSERPAGSSGRDDDDIPQELATMASF